MSGVAISSVNRKKRVEPSSVTPQARTTATTAAVLTHQPQQSMYAANSYANRPVRDRIIQLVVMAVVWGILCLLRELQVLQLPPIAVEGILPILYAAVVDYPYDAGLVEEPLSRHLWRQAAFVEQLLLSVACYLVLDSQVLSTASLLILAVNCLQSAMVSLAPTAVVTGVAFMVLRTLEPSKMLVSSIVGPSYLAAAAGSTHVAYSPPSWLIAYSLAHSIQLFLTVNRVGSALRCRIFGSAADATRRLHMYALHATRDGRGVDSGVIVQTTEPQLSTGGGSRREEQKTSNSVVQRILWHIVCVALQLTGPYCFMSVAIWYALLSIDWYAKVSLGGILLSCSVFLGPGPRNTGTPAVRNVSSSATSDEHANVQPHSFRIRRVHILFVVSIVVVDLVVYLLASPKLVTVLANGILSAHFVLYIANHTRDPLMSTMIPLVLLWVVMVAIDFTMQLSGRGVSFHQFSLSLLEAHTNGAGSFVPDEPASLFRQALAVNTTGFGLLLLISTFTDVNRAAFVADEDLKVVSYLSRANAAAGDHQQQQLNREEQKQPLSASSSSSNPGEISGAAAAAAGTSEPPPPQATNATSGSNNDLSVDTHVKHASRTGSPTKQPALSGSTSGRSTPRGGVPLPQDATIISKQSKASTRSPLAPPAEATINSSMASNDAATATTMITSSRQSTSHTSREPTPTSLPIIAPNPLTKKERAAQKKKEEADAAALAAAESEAQQKGEALKRQQEHESSEKAKKERLKKEHEAAAAAVAAAAVAELEKRRKTAALVAPLPPPPQTPTFEPSSDGTAKSNSKSSINVAAAAAAAIAVGGGSGPTATSKPRVVTPPTVVYSTPKPVEEKSEPKASTGNSAKQQGGGKPTFGDIVRGAKSQLVTPSAAAAVVVASPTAPPPAAASTQPLSSTSNSAPLSVDGALPQAQTGSPVSSNRKNEIRAISSVDGILDHQVTIPQPKSVQLREKKMLQQEESNASSSGKKKSPTGASSSDASISVVTAGAAIGDNAPPALTSPLMKASKAIVSIDAEEGEDSESSTSLDSPRALEGGSANLAVPPSPVVHGVNRPPPISPQRTAADMHRHRNNTQTHNSVPFNHSSEGSGTEGALFDAFVGLRLNSDDVGVPSDSSGNNNRAGGIDLAKFHLALTGSMLSDTIAAATSVVGGEVPPAAVRGADRNASQVSDAAVVAKIDDVISQLSTGTSPLPSDGPIFPASSGALSKHGSQFVTLDDLTRAVVSSTADQSSGAGSGTFTTGTDGDSSLLPANSFEKAPSMPQQHPSGGDLDSLLSQGFLHMLDDDTSTSPATQAVNTTAPMGLHQPTSNVYSQQDYIRMLQASGLSGALPNMIAVQQQAAAVFGTPGQPQYTTMTAMPATSPTGSFMVTSASGAYQQVAPQQMAAQQPTISSMVMTNQGPYAIVTLANGQQLMCPVLYQHTGATTPSNAAAGGVVPSVGAVQMQQQQLQSSQASPTAHGNQPGYYPTSQRGGGGAASRFSISPTKRQ